MEPPTVLFFRPLSEAAGLRINVTEKDTECCCGQHIPLAIWDYGISTLMDRVSTLHDFPGGPPDPELWCLDPPRTALQEAALWARD